MKKHVPWIACSRAAPSSTAAAASSVTSDPSGAAACGVALRNESGCGSERKRKLEVAAANESAPL